MSYDLNRAGGLITTGMNRVGSFILTLLLSSCTVYSTGFNCPDSKGARCMMLSEVDSQIDSGEIETVYLDGKCRSKSCNTDNVPKKAEHQIRKVKIMNTEDMPDEYQSGDYLYLK